MADGDIIIDKDTIKNVKGEDIEAGTISIAYGNSGGVPCFALCQKSKFESIYGIHILQMSVAQAISLKAALDNFIKKFIQ